MKSTKKQIEIMVKICERAESLNIEQGDRMTLLIDLDKANQDVGLKLRELLEANDFDFTHDIIGIQNNIDRRTGKIENCFLPRYAR